MREVRGFLNYIMIEYYKNLSLESLFYINEDGLVCQEEWRDIPNYEAIYQVSNLGRVKILKRQRFCKLNNSFSSYKPMIKKSFIEGGGYLQVMLSKEGSFKFFKIHKLLAMLFLNHVPSGYNEIVDHKNNIKIDNRLENLQLITNRHNLSKDKKGVSKYTGVCWDKKGKKWKAQISKNKITVHIIFTEDELLAKKAYEIALKNLFLFKGDNRSEFREKIKNMLIKKTSCK